MFVEGMPMNELDHKERLGQTYLSRLETQCEGNDPESTPSHSNATQWLLSHDRIPWMGNRESDCF